jgi:hypothetical protein
MERGFCGRRDKKPKGKKMVKYSLDEEMTKRAKLVVKIVDIEDTVIL